MTDSAISTIYFLMGNKCSITFHEFLMKIPNKDKATDHINFFVIQSLKYLIDKDEPFLSTRWTSRIKNLSRRSFRR